MRSTRFSFQLVLAVLAVGGGAVIGCSADLASAPSNNDPATPLQDNGSSGGTLSPKPVVDAAAVKADEYNGNPLCHADKSTCMPDDDVSQRSATNVECAALVPPPGLPDAGSPGADLNSMGCRISGVGNRVGPVCSDSSASGGDGVSCEIGGDCAPGFDCVIGDKGSRICRHYCCGGTCKGNQSNGSATFCDVQSLVDVNQKAPVCMPLKHCNKLLGTAECGANETCAVVTEAGDTGCVAVGEKRVGESCDAAHCAANLTCFGQPGARKCFKLCKVNASDCPTSQSCVTNAAFKDATFGVCQ